METQFNFLQVKEGIGHFARVGILPNSQFEGIKISDNAGAQIPSFSREWLEAARTGAEKGLQAHLNLGGNRIGLEVTTVLGAEVDTRSDTVEVAAFCAAWKALGHDESELKIEFNGQWNVCPKNSMS